MSARFEGTIKSQDQTELFFQLWDAGEKPRGTFVIVHGQAEHSECYHPFARTLQNDGWESYGFDLRGHGRSEGKRGYARHFHDYVDDARAMVEMVKTKRKNPQSPLILFGHSMGGLVATLLTLEWNSPPFQALVLSAPLFGIAVPVPAIKDYASKVLERWWPTLTLHNELNYSDLSRDEAMLKTYEHDVLRHDKISATVYNGMLAAFEEVKQKAPQLNLPLLMQVAGHDRIVSTAEAQEIFHLLPSKRNVLELYPESFHEIYNDLDRDQAFFDLRKFINPFVVSP